MTTYSTGAGTRRVLIEAAGELAAEVGFSNVSTRAVARRAGENAGSIHYHFGGKGNLFEAVLLEATKPMREEVLADVVAGYEPLLVSAEGRARALRLFVHAMIEALFRDDEPAWACRVVYQVLRKAGPLRNFVVEKVIDPWLCAAEGLFRAIDPGLTEEEPLLHAFLVAMPVYFHADYMDVILDRMGVGGSGTAYLAKLEDRIVWQTQRYFGLPCDGGERNR